MNASDARIRSAITQVAADWYAAHRVGPLSEPQRSEFLAWLKASPQHVEEYLGLAAIERSLATVTDDPAMSIEAMIALARSDDSATVVDFKAPPVPEQRRGPGARRFWRRGAAVAACTSIAIFCAWWQLRVPETVVQANTFRAGHGEQGTWTLADGTTLHVNTDTAVTVRFSRRERVLELDHGQVLVQVAHDDHRAFHVHAGGTDVVAVGTEFDVFRRPDSTLITVVAGQVAVSAGRSAPSQDTPAGLGDGVRVRAGQQVDVVAGVLPAAPRSVQVREITAWLERRIIFEERPLGAVAEEFNRYGAVPFTIDDPGLRLVKISGAFSADDTESFATFLESLDGIRVERLAKRIAVSTSHSRHRSEGRRS